MLLKVLCRTVECKTFSISNFRLPVLQMLKLETYFFQGLKVTFVRSFFQRKYKSIKDINGVLQFWSVCYDVERDVVRQTSSLQSITGRKKNMQELTKYYTHKM